MDTVEMSNLSRSVLFRASDESKYKAQVAADSAMTINPDMRCSAIVGDIVNALPRGHYVDADVVISGLDGREARLAGNAACILANRPYFDGAIQIIDGVARGFDGRNGPCYECTMSEQDWKLIEHRRSCNLLSREQMMLGHVPTTSTIASIVGGLLVQQAVLYLHGQDWFPGKAFMYAGSTFEAWSSNYSRRKDCLAHDHAKRLEQWPDFNTARSILDALSKAADHIGANPALDLRSELITKRSCTECTFCDEPMKPVHALDAGAGKCGECDADMKLDFVSSITLDSPLAHRSLADCGVVEFDLVRMRGASGSIDVVVGQWNPDNYIL